jgi:ribose-phosphate pyrophosphokinase
LFEANFKGFFGPRVPVDNLEANLVYLNYLRHQKDFDLGDVTVVSPDAGGVGRAKKFHE